MELKNNGLIYYAYLSMGSNQGDRLGNLGSALELLKIRAGTIEMLSGVYETAPWGFDAENPFLNLAISLATSLSPSELLDCCLNIEKKLGRKPHKKAGTYDSRPIDIDLLLYEQLVVSTPNLQLPHPLMHLRKFVLIPLNEIAPDLRHPLLNDTIDSLLSKCPDTLEVIGTGSWLPLYSGLSSNASS